MVSCPMLILMFAVVVMAQDAITCEPVHVLPGVSGEADGSGARPYSHLEKALEAARTSSCWQRGGRAVIYLMGDVQLHATLTLTAANSNIIITSHPDGPTRVISGGKRIPVASFRPVVLPSGSHGVVADLFSLGLNVSSLGGMGNPYPTSKMELYYQGAAMTLARDPNIEDDVLNTWRWAGYENMTKSISDVEFEFADVSRGKRWAKAIARGDDLWLHGYWKFDWRDTFVKVQSIRDEGTGHFVVERAAATPPQYPWVKGCRFYAVNALELVDAPGEYYINNTSGELFFVPPGGALSPDDVIEVSVLDVVMKSTGAQNVSIANLTLTTGKSKVASFTGASGVTVDTCTISNSGGDCVLMEGTHSSILRSSVFGCGSTGVDVAGGNTHTLVPGNISVVGNSIEHFSRVRRTYTPGVRFSGVGVYVANNTIQHGPHTGLTGSCNNCLFEHNTLSHVVFECTDAGAFYVGRSWAQRGNVARFNVFDTIRPTERLAQRSESQNAFYLDDEMSGWDFYGNTIINSTTGILLGGGRDNKIHDNIFINNDLDIHFDNRGMNWQHSSCLENCSASMGTSCFHAILVSLNYTNPPYSTAYPELVDIYAPASHPCIPVHNVIEDNRFCHKKSAGGGQFLNVDAATVHSWLSSVSNNAEDCSA